VRVAVELPRSTVRGSRRQAEPGHQVAMLTDADE